MSKTWIYRMRKGRFFRSIKHWEGNIVVSRIKLGSQGIEGGKNVPA